MRLAQVELRARLAIVTPKAVGRELAPLRITWGSFERTPMSLPQPQSQTPLGCSRSRHQFFLEVAQVSQYSY